MSDDDGSELGGFRRDGDGPPPLPSSSDDWFYVDQGEKKGPLSAVAINHLLNTKEIGDDTYVWRKGMKDWCTIRDSDLFGFVENQPPAISSYMVGNGYVWVMAFLPIIFAVIDASIDSYNQEQAAGFWGLGFTPHMISANIAWKVYPLVNGFFGWLDYNRLKKAGYGSWWDRFCAFVVPVVYLFRRAKLLKQRPYYAITWLVMFVISLVVD